MKRKTHERVAYELARMLHLDDRFVLMGANFPDLDRSIGRHRHTLHNPFILASSILVNPDFFIGVGTHLILDGFTSLEKAYNFARRILNAQTH